MKRPDFIARQSGNPKGLLGGLIARIMAKETAPENLIALDLLELEEWDRLLEIGSGHGATLAEAAVRMKNGSIAGIDISKVMVRLAEKTNQQNIKSKLIQIHRASSDDIPYPAKTFTKLLSIHTIYFLDDLPDHLAEIFRVTAPGGRFVLGFRPGEDEGFAENFPDNVYQIRLKSEVLRLLEAAGFETITVHEEDPGRGRVVFAVVERPGD